MKNQVYLIPGLFGFTELGAFNYFHQVAEILKQQLDEQGVDAEIIEVETIPTGSVRRRAERLIRTVSDHGGLEADNLHFIGHSTGGLDIRLMLTPGVNLMADNAETLIAGRTRTAISLSTPHYGTHLANFFTSLNGRNLLLLLTLMATSGPGRFSVYTIARFLRHYSRLDHLLGQKDNILDSLGRNLFDKIRLEEGDAIWQYLRRISEDQGALIQLTPEGMDLFNAAAPDRPGVNYVSFVSASPPPDSRLLIPRPGNIYQPFTHLIYKLCYQLAQQEHPHYPYPAPQAEMLARATEAVNLPLDATSNDGVVPTLSQFWGEVGGVYRADHMDVVGHFQHVSDGRSYHTWMMSGSGFNEDRFATIWRDISEVVVRNQVGNKISAQADI
jgi:triacylglycerol esterase/lipase EstA (alpha/beta hydrolase family)